ncbi:hypothetical protein [Limobrevibacterium gyesilva]|uniref:Uncharacterized protein n=1 Tax=Limobrevibacterium gyesilva TaxID=2991712 RepID=A0AA41YWI7_9PROT|nr:hypothetical protein [Limobrevibacterium gyesilva]MCW3477788.1 hypothetical protein [Limobrevibacterium gyesilva]
MDADAARNSPPRDLKGVLNFIVTTSLCNQRQARELASAIRSFGAWAGLRLDHLPADTAAIRRHVERLHPEAVGVSPARFANVTSLLNRALTLAGVKPCNRPVAEALSVAWNTVFASLSNRYLRSSLAPFARFCSASGVAPDAVSDGVSSLYLEHLTKTSLVKDPQTVYQTVCRTWNQARAKVLGWPAVTLTIPS